MVAKVKTIPDGVNPARAGMIPRLRRRSMFHVSKPRASGDDPVTKHSLD